MNWVDMAKAKKKAKTKAKAKPKRKAKASKKPSPKKKAKRNKLTEADRKKATEARRSHTKQISDTGLTDMQDKFVREYVIHLNGAKAARLAGYSERTADAQASQLLSNPKVRKALAQAIDARNRRLDASADRVLLELTACAFYRIGDIASWKKGIVTITDIDKISLHQQAPIRSIEQKTTKDGKPCGIKLTMNDRARFLELLMRHMGMLDPTGRQDTKGTIVEFMERLKRGED